MKKVGNRTKLCCRAVALAATGMVFQVSSCTLGEGGVIDAFADTGALSEIGRGLWEASPIGRLLDGFDGSFEVSVGGDE